MKKLYNTKTKRVHPSPPPPTSPILSLPAALLTLAAALSPEDQQVLSYLLSNGTTSSTNRKQRRNLHSPDLTCGCFSCYTTFWARWDASPNRHTIHLILDYSEENLESQTTLTVAGGRRRGGRRRRADVDGDKVEGAMVGGQVAEDDGGDADVEDGVEGGEGQSSVRRLVSFIGERVWGVWGQ